MSPSKEQSEKNKRSILNWQSSSIFESVYQILIFFSMLFYV